MIKFLAGVLVGLTLAVGIASAQVNFGMINSIDLTKIIKTLNRWEQDGVKCKTP